MLEQEMGDLAASRQDHGEAFAGLCADVEVLARPIMAKKLRWRRRPAQLTIRIWKWDRVTYDLQNSAY
jgi:hypothetical protein